MSILTPSDNVFLKILKSLQMIISGEELNIYDDPVEIINKIDGNTELKNEITIIVEKLVIELKKCAEAIKLSFSNLNRQSKIKTNLQKNNPYVFMGNFSEKEEFLIKILNELYLLASRKELDYSNTINIIVKWVNIINYKIN